MSGCEAIIGEFVWGSTRCGQTVVAEAIDATWGTVHGVCAEHAPTTDTDHGGGSADESEA